MLPAIKSMLRPVAKNRYVNFFRRIFYATKYFNHRYVQILSWGIRSKEDTNFTYALTRENILYLAHTIAVVTQKDVREVLRYIEEAESDLELKQHVVRETQQHPDRRTADPRCDFGRRLGWYAFVRILKPRVVVETGVDKGLGAVLLCAALLRNREEGSEGQYFGTDINPKAGYLLSGKYAGAGQILYGDSIESLKRLTVPIDLFINDSDHSPDYEYEEYRTVQDKISDRAILLGDNAHFSSKLAVFSTETNRRFLFFREVPDKHWYPGAGIGISYKP